MFTPSIKNLLVLFINSTVTVLPDYSEKSATTSINTFYLFCDSPENFLIKTDNQYTIFPKGQSRKIIAI